MSTWKQSTYTITHTIHYSGLEFPTPMNKVYCRDCIGTGYDKLVLQPGTVITYPALKCEQCSGHGVPPIPACEIGL